MKTIAIAVMLAVIMAISLPVFAEDGNNVLDQLGDIFSGKGNSYAGVEAIKDIALNAPILGVDKIGLKLWADCLIGEIDENIDRDVRGGARLRLIF